MPKKTPTKKAVKKVVKPKKATSKTAAKTTKKTVKATKSTTKKTATKKASAKKKQVRALVCAPGGQCFWTTDGTVLEDLNQLQIAFGSMEDEVFLHHVTKEKNDFADWVEFVLEDSGCASDLRKSKKPATSRTVVVKHLRFYSF